VRSSNFFSSRRLAIFVVSSKLVARTYPGSKKNLVVIVRQAMQKAETTKVAAPRITGRPISAILAALGWLFV
jgi:hypothetical protein